MAFLGLYGEPFNEMLANIRAHSPFKETFVSGYTNGMCRMIINKFMLGYHPSYDAKEDGLPGDIYSKPESIEYAIVDSVISVLTGLKGTSYQRHRFESVAAFVSSHGMDTDLNSSWTVSNRGRHGTPTTRHSPNG